MRIGIYANVIIAVLTFSTPAQALDPEVEDDCMLRHEVAHVCGWPADHPDHFIDMKCEAKMPTKHYNQCKPMEIKRVMPYEMATVCHAPACTLCYERGCVVYLPARDKNIVRKSAFGK